MRRCTPILIALLLPAAGLPGAAAELNWFEWAAIAPVVVEGDPLGEEGHHTRFRVTRSLRGDVASDSTALINLRLANRDRLREVDPKSLHLEIGISYLVLLEPSDKRQEGQIVYSLVRGIHGVRELPPEGKPAILEAVARFIEIQERKSESVTWTSLTSLLEETNPILIGNALDQFLKFRRGTPELTLSLVPLLDHPLSELRARAAELIGQVVEGFGADLLPEEQSLRGEIFAAARRDPSVDVRIAACRALRGFLDQAVAEVLREIAETDPDQNVRYEAEKQLFERQSGTGRTAAPPPQGAALAPVDAAGPPTLD